MSKKTREQVSTVVRYTVLILVGFVMFYPMLWMVGASFKASNNEIYSHVHIINGPLHFLYVLFLIPSDIFKNQLRSLYDSHTVPSLSAYCISFLNCS